MTTQANALDKTFHLLVESSIHDVSEDDNSVYSYDYAENRQISAAERQGALCEQLLAELKTTQSREPKRHSSAQNNSRDDSTLENDNRSIRDLFPNTKVYDLLPSVLNPLLNDRVDTECLLPGTQDETANEEILSESTKAAFSLTLPSMQAGRLYAHLLNRPGALGSGLVDLEPLTALLALVRRWTVECCGREQFALVSSSGSSSTFDSMTYSPSKSPPQKRSRRGSRSNRMMKSRHDNFEDGENNSEEQQIHNVLAMGTLVAAEICQIPQQPEFASWSSESREVLIEATLVSIGTVAALLGKKRNTIDTSFDDKRDNNRDNLLQKMIISQGQQAFEQCLVVVNEKEDQENDDPQRQQQQHQQCHETAIIILRGLMHLLQLKVVLPNGERGKIEAFTAASKIMSSLMRKCNLAWVASKEKCDSSLKNKTPSRVERRRSSIGGVLKIQTPRSTISKSRRKSLDGGSTPMVSPVLKKKHNNENRGLPSGTINGVSKVNDKPRGIQAIFLGLLQKLTTGRVGLEKAALRRSTVDTIQSCMKWLPHAERSHFLEYIIKICHSKVSVHRLVACEIMGNVLFQDWIAEHENDLISKDDYDDRSFYDTNEEKETGDKNTGIQLPQALWKALQGRLMDRIAAVRASAANSLENVMTEIQKNDKISVCYNKGESLLIALRKRAIKDETSTVRKAAVLALTKVLLAQKEYISSYYISAICDLCQDSSLLTRRAAAEALTTLLKACISPHQNDASIDLTEDLYDVGLIEEAWSTCVLPMVLDEETSITARNAFHKVVILPIVEEDDINGTQKKQVAWRILANVGNLTCRQGASKGAFQALQTALSHLGREDPNLIHIELFEIVTYMASSTLSQSDHHSEVNAVGVWSLLEALLCIDYNGTRKSFRTSKKIDLSFCLSAWKVMIEKHSSMPKSAPHRSTLKSSLVVLSKIANTFASTDSDDILLTLNQHLLGFQFPPDALGPAISAMTELTKRTKSGENSNESWIKGIFSESEKEIKRFVQDANADSSVTEFRKPKLLRALFSVGEASMIGFKLDDDGSSPTPLFLKPSKRLKELVQIIVSGHLPGAAKPRISSAIRAHAFTVLGKFCLRDEDLARQSLTLFARELHPSLPNPSQSVQSNALLVMGDLCVRYTNMTDRYLPTMASCLQNGCTSDISVLERSSVVRKHAVLLLSSLLLQDYIKWRGLLFHRFLVACSDDDEEVAVLAESVLSGPLMVRNPKIFFNHFVESIFVLNRCVAHPIYVSATRQGDGGSGIAVGFDGINLDGKEGEARRRNMYNFLLSKLTDEEKIGVTARLAKEVLGEAVGNEGDLSQVCKRLSPPDESSSPRLKSAWNVLSDTLYVLTNKSIKVGRVQDEVDGGIDDPNQVVNPSRQVNVAKTRLLSKISLKHMVEIVLPILCNLKVKLQASRSPLLKELMAYLLEIFRNHKVEVKEFLANDPTLLQEIEYDSRKHASNSEV
ncbi:unnamed protein product [Pseudo-nitzschia multistriata]|uniref:Condensin complex subunit 1 C-terminal domain-containing protein n=1 Tax=Pseudo-nitzschia multistriata TaxID=183589 RepID=A0A448ZCN5_9STRA|nr:unnamed protein product [Pseudo-nitzschia multistriata]